MIQVKPDLPLWISATDGRYRVTVDATTNEPCEFFDLETDPDETANGVEDKKHANQINDMREKIQQMIEPGK